MSNKINTDFDQIFREKLHDHEVMPPESVWAGVQASGLGATAVKSSHWRWWAAASVLALILTSSYLYFGNNNSDENTIQDEITIESPSIEKSIQTEESNIVIENIENTLPEPKTEIETENIKIKEPAVIVQLKNEDIEQVEKMIFEEESVVQEIIEDLVVEESNLEESIADIANERSTTPDKLNATSSNKILDEKNNSIDLESPTNNAKISQAGKDFFDDDEIDDMISGHKHEKYWVFGLEFSPEWVTVPDANNNIEAYGLDLTARYQISKFFVETGLGVAFSKDKGENTYVTEQAHFKGSYEDVYDVTFENGQETPTYYTKTVNIYDTVNKLEIVENPNKYTYLNIPINFGYYTKLGSKFSFYAKLGLNSSFKVYENIPGPTIKADNADDFIINATPLYHKRTDWHLQSQINVGINYHITDKFLFGLEPNARYYIKSLVDGNNSGNPYGLGVKVGFKYILK